jgi:hypothetical protein
MKREISFKDKTKTPLYRKFNETKMKRHRNCGSTNFAEFNIRVRFGLEGKLGRLLSKYDCMNVCGPYLKNYLEIYGSFKDFDIAKRAIHCIQCFDLKSLFSKFS